MTSTVEQQGTSLAASTGDYFDNPLRVLMVLGAFALFTIPVCLLPAMVPFGDYFATGVWLLLGMTHIWMPLSIYLRQDNLDYFRSSTGRKWIFFILPPILLLTPALLEALVPMEGGHLYDHPRFINPDALTPGAYPAVAVLVYIVALRGFEFYHVNMQTFGILEMFKKRSRKSLAWMRKGNRATFLLLAVTLLVSFVQGGRAQLSSPALMAMLGLCAALVLPMLVGFVMVWRGDGFTLRGAVPLIYYVLQVAAMGLAIWRFEFWGAALSVHYVEYHLMMRARCFDAPLRKEPLPDRIMAWFSRHRVAFYGVLVLLASYVVFLPGLMDAYQVEPTFSTKVMASLLNGIFLVHYFVEAFIWRFSNPYFRKALAPLYFHRPSGATTAPAAAPAGAAS